MTIPTTVPVLRPPGEVFCVLGARSELDDEEGESEDAGLVEGRGDSGGKGSPGLRSVRHSEFENAGNPRGCNIYVESIASVRCLSMLMLLFILIPPTIPQVMQLPGAEQ